MEEKPKTHGGKRPGAGRKPANGIAESTVVMRIPASQSGVVRNFLSALTQKRLHESQDNVFEISQFSASDTELSLPLYTSKVAAGYPAPADDHVEKRLNPSEYLIENDRTTFFVRVKGESMIDAGIFDNDVLVVDRSRTPNIGDIVLALLDGEFTVKTLGKSKSGPRLIPANSNFPVIEVHEHQSFELFGVVTGSMRKFK